MEKLELYKKLSLEDKSNLTAYCVYDSIYAAASNAEKCIEDNEVERIYELSNYLYLKDEYYNFSAQKIADFIAIGFLEKNVPLEIMEKTSKDDMFYAIDNDNYEILLEDKIER